MTAEIPATGAWYGLAAIFRHQEQEFGSWSATVTADGGLACPRDGEPLTSGPATSASSGVSRFCRFCGWRAPRDVVTPQRGVMMGESG